MKSCLDEVRKYKEGLDNDNNNVIYCFNQLIDEINKNDELRNKFNEIYNGNLFLLENPQELYARINNLSDMEKIENVKKLVMKDGESR